MGNMLGVVARPPGDRNQIDSETLIEQKPHDTAMSASRRRLRRIG